MFDYAIEKYIQSALPSQQEAIRELVIWIQELAPQLESYALLGMIGFGRLKQCSDNAKPWPLIGIASKKSYITLFIGAQRDGVPLTQLYTQAELGNVRIARHCINVRHIEDLNKEGFLAMLKEAIELG